MEPIVISAGHRHHITSTATIWIAIRLLSLAINVKLKMIIAVPMIAESLRTKEIKYTVNKIQKDETFKHSFIRARIMNGRMIDWLNDN